MRLARLVLRSLPLVCAASAVLVFAGSASAIQFTPTAASRVHFLFDGQPGVPWTTAGGGTVDYNSISEGIDPGLLSVTAEVPQISYWDPGNGACSTAFTTCTEVLATPLDLSVEASFVSMFVPGGGGVIDVVVNFETTDDGLPDIVWEDAGVEVLRANWSAGSFFGDPTTGLEMAIQYDTDLEVVVGSPDLIGFALVDATSTYADLFEDAGERNILDLSEFLANSFTPTLNTLISDAISSGELGSFTAQGQGEVFRIQAGQFVPIPEPSTGLLLGAALMALGALRRARDG